MKRLLLAHLSTSVALVTALVANGHCQASPPQKPILGVEVSDRPSAFVDLVKVARPFQRLSDGPAAPVDEHGWPKSDFQVVLMDDRPAMAWAPPIDDPLKKQPNEYGAYTLIFRGKAEVSAQPGSPIQLSPITYDSATGLSKATATLAPGSPALIVLAFKNTQRSEGDQPGTGITDVQFLRPGYSAAKPQLFTNDFLKALKPFSYLRFMGWLDTNSNPGYYGDKGHHISGWNDRSLPNDAFQGDTTLRPGARGICWEYIIRLANAVHKDIWINVPIAASGWTVDDKSSYVFQLAKLLRDGDAATEGKGLDKGLKIYIEDSNEVWNFGFPQYIWNKLAAEDEVAHGDSPLNKDGSTDHEQWARRRHAMRLYQIAMIFKSVLGDAEFKQRVRPIYAGWTIQPGWYDEVLGWMDKTYGPPKNYFWAMAETGYFNAEGASKTATVAEILAAMGKDSTAGVQFTSQLRKIADKYGLKLADYEAGPDNGGGDPTNVGNRVMANRTQEMGDLVYRHFSQNIFGQGVDAATYFALASGFSRYGCWGAVEDLSDLNTPKYKAVLKLVRGFETSGKGTESSQNSVEPPANLTLRSSGQKVLLSWSAEPGATYTIWFSSGGNFQVLARGLQMPRYQSESFASGSRIVFYATATVQGVTSPPSQQVAINVK